LKFLDILHCIVPRRDANGRHRAKRPRARTLLLVTLVSAPIARPAIADDNALLAELSAYEVRDVGFASTASDGVAAAIDIDGAPRTIRLQPKSFRSAGFQVLVQGPDGRLAPVDPPPISSYRGVVEGTNGGEAVASLTDGRLTASLKLDSDTWWHVQPMPGSTTAGGSVSHVVFSDQSILPRDVGCGADHGPNAASNRLSTLRIPKGASVAGATASTGPKICAVAFDADYEFFVKNGSSVADTVRDIENVMNLAAFIYEVELNITFEITTIIVRTAEPDPYSSTNNAALLTQFSNHWNLNHQGVHRDIAHLMTGKDIDNNIIGSANNGVVCDVCGNARGYAFSESRFSSLMPSRVCVTAHEIGHNFNAVHCDGDADCYIMCSQIHGCGGSVTMFGARSYNAITNHAAGAACLSTLEPPLTLPFCDTFEFGLSATDWSYNGMAATSSSAVNPPSGSAAMVIDTCCTPCAAAPDEIRSNFILLGNVPQATLSYHTQHGGGANTAGSQLIVEYWNNDREWIELNRATANGIAQTGFVLWTHELPAEAMHDEFRFRFRLDGIVNQATWYIDDVSVSDVTPELPVMFVRSDAPPGGTGTSWATAYADLQDALAVAACSRNLVNEIWVAGGTYKPDQGSGNRAATFQLVNGIAIVGGFAGTESTREARDILRHATVLSGDLGTPVATFDNSYHVVTGTGSDESAVLDGFVITGGNANGASPNNGGAGLWVVGGSPTILNCTFRNNTAANGAAVLNFAAAPTFRGCLFHSNSASSFSGGAMRNNAGSTVTVERCRFVGNTGIPSGGAISNAGSSMMISDSLFSGNQAMTGGAIFNSSSSVTLVNCTISRNFASSFGGGVVEGATLLNSILWGNSDATGSGQSAQMNTSFPESILADSTTIQGWTGSFPGTGGNGSDPLFVDSDGPDNLVGTLDDDLRLMSASPSRNSGDPNFTPAPGASDLAGHARMLCGIVDRGAFEMGMADPDCNQMVTLADYINAAACMTGPFDGPFDEGCESFDFDGDGGVDLLDAARFQNAFGQPHP